MRESHGTTRGASAMLASFSMSRALFHDVFSLNIPFRPAVAILMNASVWSCGDSEQRPRGVLQTQNSEYDVPLLHPFHHFGAPLTDR
jgi:hypothetical protein